MLRPAIPPWQEFDAFPGDLVRYAPGGQVDPAQDRRGVVQRMDAAQRLVWVRWQAGAAGHPSARC